MTSTPGSVDRAALDDLRARLRATRRVMLTHGVGWDRGTDPAYLDDLLPYWAESYDWRVHEERLRALPWVRAGEGFALHQQARDPGASTVVLLHGWPDSFLRFERVLPLLDDVNVVVPCLPGYPYGPPVTEPSTATRAAMAEHTARLLDALGHDRYVVSGGDIGSGVAQALARTRPDRVSALHLTDVPLWHLATVPDAELSEAGRAYRDDAQNWGRREGAYMQLQATKPHTVAVGLGDSPAGLAAWIVEKLRSWSDCDGDVESVFPREDLLTWVTLYWLTGTIGSSFASYFERPTTPPDRIEVPTVVTIFPRDLVRAPRDFAERVFDLRGWSEEKRGGHFGAWEQPERFTAALRMAVELPTG